jgi:biopolymer transport protein ExbD
MCDVLLVLLVFFISITATSALRSDRAIELPVGPNATKKATARSEALINVKWVPEKSAGVVAIESKVITELPAVTEMLAPRSKVDPNYRVVIRADRKTPAQYVEKVMPACAEAGITDIAFSVLNRDCHAHSLRTREIWVSDHPMVDDLYPHPVLHVPAALSRSRTNSSQAARSHVAGPADAHARRTSSKSKKW